jgi:large subunit ribosomal protein L35Ae
LHGAACVAGAYKGCSLVSDNTCVACTISIISFRLYVKGVMMGFKRGLRNQYEHTSLLKIQNVQSKEDVAFYLGKRVCFIYKAKKEIRGSKFRTIWGRVTRAHGSG